MARIYFESTAVTLITLPSTGWSNSAPYAQTVSITGMTADSAPVQGLIYPDQCTEAERMDIQQNAAYIYEMVTSAGSATFYATNKPVVDITLGLKGVY